MNPPAEGTSRGGARPGAGGSARSVLPAIAAGVVILTLSAGWFVMSKFAEGTPSGDAFSESVGVAFGLLIVASVVGAVVERRRDRARR
jgi:hypothetical protein